MKNTQDWLEGFNYGKQVGIDETVQRELKALESLEEQIHDITKTVDYISNSRKNIFERLFGFY